MAGIMISAAEAADADWASARSHNKPNKLEGNLPLSPAMNSVQGV
jgi:hypothetical protein